MIPVIIGLAGLFWASNKVGNYIQDKLDPTGEIRAAEKKAKEDRAAYLKTPEGQALINRAYMEYSTRIAGNDPTVAKGLRISDFEDQYIKTGKTFE